MYGRIAPVKGIGAFAGHFPELSPLSICAISAWYVAESSTAIIAGFAESTGAGAKTEESAGISSLATVPQFVNIKEDNKISRTLPERDKDLDTDFSIRCIGFMTVIFNGQWIKQERFISCFILKSESITENICLYTDKILFQPQTIQNNAREDRRFGLLKT